jgi:cell division septal protein FtsQ
MADEINKSSEKKKKRMMILRFFLALLIAAVNITILIFIIKLIINRLGEFG